MEVRIDDGSQTGLRGELLEDFQRFVADPEGRKLLRQEALKIAMQELVCRVRGGVSDAELARRAGCSPSSVHRFFDGRNPSVTRLSDLLDALGYDLRIEAIPRVDPKNVVRIDL